MKWPLLVPNNFQSKKQKGMLVVEVTRLEWPLILLVFKVQMTVEMILLLGEILLWELSTGWRELPFQTLIILQFLALRGGL